MKTVYLETDPRPVEEVVTAEGGMERADRSTYMGVNLAALQAISGDTGIYVWGKGGGPHFGSGGTLSAPSMDPAYTGRLVNSADQYVSAGKYDALRSALLPPIVPARCRSVLAPEGI